MSTKSLQDQIVEDIRVMTLALEAMQYAQVLPQTQAILERAIRRAKEEVQ